MDNSDTNPIIRMGEKSTDGGRLHMFDGGVEKIAFYTDGTDNHISAGQLGIGTSSPDELLHLKTAEATIKFESTHGRSSFINQGGGNFHIKAVHSSGVGINYGDTSNPGLLRLYNNTTAKITLNASAGTIASGAITALAKGTQLGTSGYYINSIFKDGDANAAGENVGVFLAHNDTNNGTGAIAGINQLAFLTYGSAWTQALLLDTNQNATFAGDITLDENLTFTTNNFVDIVNTCLLYTSPSPRDLSTSRMPSSA